MRRWLAAATLLLASLWAAQARANPADAFGFGARSTALGGAATAAADDTSANYYNPAALARGDALRLELGYRLVQPRLKLSGGDLAVDKVSGFEGGVVLPGELWGHRVAASVGLYLPDARLTRVRALPERQPRFALYDNRPQRLIISASLAVELWDDLYVGAGLTFLSNAEGEVLVSGVVNATDETQTTLFSGVDVGFPSVRYPAVGVLWAPGRWRLGATFRQEFSLALDLTLRVDGQIAIGSTLIDGAFRVRSRNVNLFSPRQYAVGVAYEAPRWLVSLDLSYLEWRHFPAPTAILDLALEVPGLPLTLPPALQPQAPHFRDILVPRIGGEWRWLDGPHLGLTLRGGYFYEPSPAPDQPGVTNYVDSDKHGLSAGVGLRFSEWTEVLPGPLLLDLTGQVIVMPSRVYRKDDPADPVGDYEAAGIFWGGSMAWRFLF
jgi:long-chain fatty acid transport protein